MIITEEIKKLIYHLSPFKEIKLKRHHIYIIGGILYLALFLIIGLIVISNAYSSVSIRGGGTAIYKPQNLVIGLVLISQSLVVFVSAVFYALKTRPKDD